MSWENTQGRPHGVRLVIVRASHLEEDGCRQAAAAVGLSGGVVFTHVSCLATVMLKTRGRY